MNVLKLLGPLALCAAVSACSTVEYIEVTPNCSPVVIPNLPVIDNGDLWDALGDEKYRVIESYADGLWGIIDEQAAIISEVCGDTED